MTTEEKIAEIQKGLEEHDCHLGEEDGCVCMEAREELEILQTLFMKEQEANAQDYD